LEYIQNFGMIAFAGPTFLPSVLNRFLASIITKASHWRAGSMEAKTELGKQKKQKKKKKKKKKNIVDLAH